MRLVFILPPSELFAIAGGVQTGVPRFVEGNLAPLPKMTQVTRRHTQNLACLIKVADGVRVQLLLRGLQE
jgi:hypothetical protein